MPIDYSKYPENWKTEIRPRILSRANNCCEVPGCGLAHNSYVYSVLVGKNIQWFYSKEEAILNGVDPKMIKVIITIAHLDHDEDNHNVTDDRLMAMCQLHHLRYDAEEKRKRKNQTFNQK